MKQSDEDRKLMEQLSANKEVQRAELGGYTGIMLVVVALILAAVSISGRLRW